MRVRPESRWLQGASEWREVSSNVAMKREEEAAGAGSLVLRTGCQDRRETEPIQTSLGGKERRNWVGLSLRVLCSKCTKMHLTRKKART